MPECLAASMTSVPGGAWMALPSIVRFTKSAIQFFSQVCGAGLQSCGRRPRRPAGPGGPAQTWRSAPLHTGTASHSSDLQTRDRTSPQSIWSAAPPRPPTGRMSCPACSSLNRRSARYRCAAPCRRESAAVACESKWCPRGKECTIRSFRAHKTEAVLELAGVAKDAFLAHDHVSPDERTRPDLRSRADPDGADYGGVIRKRDARVDVNAALHMDAWGRLGRPRLVQMHLQRRRDLPQPIPRGRVRGKESAKNGERIGEREKFGGLHWAFSVHKKAAG